MASAKTFFFLDANGDSGRRASLVLISWLRWMEQGEPGVVPDQVAEMHHFPPLKREVGIDFGWVITD